MTPADERRPPVSDVRHALAPSCYSAVTIYGPDGTVLRTISAQALQARPSPFIGSHAPVVERATARAYYPTVTPARRQKAARNLANRNRARARRRETP